MTLIDRISKLLEDPKTATEILLSYDWKCAFERIDATLVALKIIKLGILRSVVKVVIDFLKEQKMLMKMNGLLDYDVFKHVPSDLTPGQLFLPPDTFKTQNYKDQIFQWSNDNKMGINQEQSNYMVKQTSYWNKTHHQVNNSG